MIPLSDENPTFRTPVITILLLLSLSAVWILVQGGGFDEKALAASVSNLGLVPGELTHLAAVGEAVPIAQDLACVVDREPINVLTPVLSMFLHGSWGHLLGNALFLWCLATTSKTARVEAGLQCSTCCVGFPQPWHKLL